MEAAETGNEAMVALLLRYGANAHDVGVIHGMTVLDNALRFSRSTKISRSLIEAGADVNAQDRTNESILHFAVLVGDLDQVKLLVEHGANVNHRTKLQRTPLHFGGQREITKYLLECGANVNEPDFEGQTPLHRSVLYHSLKSVKMCLEFGGDLTLRDNAGETCVHYAAMNRRTDVLEFVLQETGLSVNERSGRGEVPLHLAAKKGNVDACTVLLDRGADVDAKNVDGLTPMALAAFNPNMYSFWKSMILELFLSHGATLEKEFVDEIVRKAAATEKQIIIKHLAKLNSVGIERTEMNREYFKHCMNTQYFDECITELEKMKNCRFYGNITLFDIYTKNDIGGYASNEDLIKKFHMMNSPYSFPNHAEILSRRLQKMINKQKMILIAADVLNSVFRLDEPMIYERILSYLTIYELSVLTSALPGQTILKLDDRLV